MSESHQPVVIEKWSQLYAIASTGKIKTWQISVTANIDQTATIITNHGYIDGKLTTKNKVILKGKNIGKSNETTPYQQAVNQAQSTYNKKIDKKYITEIPTDDNKPDFILPMLAKDFSNCKHKEYPALAQPKLNGVRCMAQRISDEEINFTSRGGKSYNETLGHLTKYLLPIMKPNEIFDGEIYKYGWSLQQIIRRVKKMRHDTNLLEYWVYDVANDEPTMHRNDRYFNAIKPATNPKIVPVYTEMVANEKEVYQLHDKYVQQGYEGIIIRQVNAYYKFDHRSLHLQKYKKFIDDEFEIIGGSADADGGVVFECKIDDDHNFCVRPKGTLEQRIHWMHDIKNIIGKELTVRYFELSDDGIPLQPVGIVIRDYE